MRRYWHIDIRPYPFRTELFVGPGGVWDGGEGGGSCDSIFQPSEVRTPCRLHPLPFLCADLVLSTSHSVWFLSSLKSDPTGSVCQFPLPPSLNCRYVVMAHVHVCDHPHFLNEYVFGPVRFH